MKTRYASFTPSNSQSTFSPAWAIRFTICIVLISVSACSRTAQTGPQSKLRLEVGQIKEVTLSASGDGSTQLVGTSDNQEVVDVTRKQPGPESTATIQTGDSGPIVFLIKGVTVGKANVTFSEKKTGEEGSGQAKKTYVVEVRAK
ncbi:hypothetical protein [Spirosoma knui]